MAPIYDSGSSLGYDKMPGQMRSEKEVVCKPFKKYHLEQLKLVSSFDWVKFDKLNDVKELVVDVLSAEGTGDYIDENRIRAIADGVQRRIGKLLQFAMIHQMVQSDTTEDDVQEDVAEDYNPEHTFLPKDLSISEKFS